MEENWLEIGTIVAPQGLEGELRVLSVSDFPERFQKRGIRGIQGAQGGEIQEITLLRGRELPGKNVYVIKLEGVENREQAEALRGYKLWANKLEKPRLKADEYHVSELVNLEVYHHLTGEKIGVVVDIFWAGNDILAVQLEANLAPLKKKSSSSDSEARALVPFVKEIVPLVDLKAARIEITPPPGLLEINLS
ncbi:MAG: ribosome maturation factor RimM [Microcystis sp.]|jgi:16S rRNA processing protein RimM|uniref:Ribosome maturation factor RimM n=5 Tax=Microcystis TaxID=1125 RepID=I4IMF0_MICAE|nr:MULTISPECIES: ribosome maturation factor RimM [Microcystis]MCA2817070.1 ribosome maturation factor RimM [Microcystis sp. M085S1]MCA2856081.1 ribosome maturation factor RimM [Microcystis sp. M065S1]MCZ8054609.1 ribosome maturation factor RimM [Microcystis sp. LE19-12.2C]TRT81118.1 MAG: ribosome maturation factor RimM [Microcystis flos-aquae Ma_QC_C_20070823_S18]TRT92419.1 MAG: ribosome maturation factor RimM [Microcystis flos-aquae Ma_QC_C_20070823_S18D]TRV08866.1 MAG: ribosome maturation f